jgi:hypothetical protein
MRRARLRGNPTADELATLYASPHDARLYGYGHELRVQSTIALGKTTCGPEPGRVIDLSCGNAVIPRAIGGHFGCPVVLGDFAGGYQFHGPIEESIREVAEWRKGDAIGLFILSETIEHLEEPDEVLMQIGSVADQLIVSTPIDERGAGTPEHIWSWDIEYVKALLHETGWTTTDTVELYLGEGYDYQIHRAHET